MSHYRTEKHFKQFKDKIQKCRIKPSCTVISLSHFSLFSKMDWKKYTRSSLWSMIVDQFAVVIPSFGCNGWKSFFIISSSSRVVLAILKKKKKAKDLKGRKKFCILLYNQQNPLKLSAFCEFSEEQIQLVYIVVSQQPANHHVLQSLQLLHHMFLQLIYFRTDILLRYQCISCAIMTKINELHLNFSGLST